MRRSTRTPKLPIPVWCPSEEKDHMVRQISALYLFLLLKFGLDFPNFKGYEFPIIAMAVISLVQWALLVSIVTVLGGWLWNRICSAPAEWLADLALLGQVRKQKLRGTAVVCGGR